MPLGHLQGSPCFTRGVHMEALNLRDRLAIAKRSPRRVSITVSHSLYQRLVATATGQGRSVSNLCAYLLEVAAPPAD